MLRRLLISWVVLAVAIAFTVWLVPGIEVTGGIVSYLWIAALFAVINVLIGPILKLLSAPLIVLTLGLFALLINALLLVLTAWISSSLSIDNFWHALVGAFVISIVDAILEAVLPKPDRH
jgi:putative membrane protein